MTSAISEDGYWAVINDFDPQSSRADYCSVSGMRKRADDAGVFRPVVNGMVAFEGYFDISQYAIEQAAKMLGWASPEQVADLQERLLASEEREASAYQAGAKKVADAAKMAGVRAAKADL